MPGRKKVAGAGMGTHRVPASISPSPRRVNVAKRLEPAGSLHLRPTRAEIDLGALLHNLAAVRQRSPATAILAVVKANAYGHGAVLCARALEGAGVDMLGVALVEEGIELRRAGLTTPILVLGGSYEGACEQIVEHRLVPVVYRRDQVEQLGRAARSRRATLDIHVKIDTGMGRIGATLPELDKLCKALASTEGVRVDGALSHFANADLADPEMTRLQLERFDEALQQMELHGIPPTWRHLSNSAGVIGLPAARNGLRCNMVRPGIMLYGEVPAERMKEAAGVQPVLSWKTRIVHLKRVPAGTPISYGGRWSAIRESVIATLPVGYADGYSRKLTNSGEVLVRGARAPVAGTVCMDMCMIDVTGIPGAALGDEVVLLGSQGKERISAQELAERCGTIHYEILCGISSRVPRVEVSEG